MSAECQYARNICKLLLKDRYLRIDYKSNNTSIWMDDAKPANLSTMQAWGNDTAMRKLKYFENNYINEKE